MSGWFAVTACLIAAAAGAPNAGVPTAPSAPAPQRLIFVQIPTRSPAAEEQARHPGGPPDLLPDGSRIVAFDPAEPAKGVTVLTNGFAAAGRPDLSFDGRRVLFIAKRNPAETFGVWEMRVDGSDPRRVTDPSVFCADAIYLSTLYTIDADAPFEQICFLRTGGGRWGNLYTCLPDGTRATQITFSPYGVSDPYLLRDGRLLISSPLPASERGAPGRWNASLLTVHTDGTDLFPFAGVHESPAFRGMACETSNGWVFYVESRAGRIERGGSLVAVRPARSLHTRRPVAGEKEGTYLTPTASAGGRLLVAFRGRQAKTYGIYDFDPKTGKRGACVYDAPDWDEVDAHVIQPRRAPAGRSSVVDRTGDTGFLYCLNAYLSDSQATGKAADQKIARLQVYRAIRRNPSATTKVSHTLRDGIITEELLGEAPVARDGSFYLMLPARMPFRLRTLNADGGVLRSMRSWIWVMPNEHRGCIGCHEDRERAPPNRQPLALRQAPSRLSLDGRKAARSPASNR